MGPGTLLSSAHVRLIILACLLFTRRCAAAAIATPAGWVSLGCYPDNILSRTLQTTISILDLTLTAKTCTAACKAKGFILAGVESGSQCYCDNTIRNSVVPYTTTTNCASLCLGNLSQICGGANSLIIYKLSSSSSTSSSSSSSSSSKRVSSSISTSISTSSRVSTTSSSTISSSTSSSTRISTISSSTSTLTRSSAKSSSASTSTLVSTTSSSTSTSTLVSTSSSSTSTSTGSSTTSTSATTLSIPTGLTVSGTVLVFARDTVSAYSGTSGLNAYGIPYQLVIVPSNGITLPNLTASATSGPYGGIIILSEVSYQYSDGFYSALTADQWQQLYAYQTAFGVRMVRIDAYPSSDFGVATTSTTGSGCCDTDVEQLISFSDTSDFTTANVKTGATMSTANMWHYPATIVDVTIAKEIAQFAPSGSFPNRSTAAVINNFGVRQQMVWFTSWGTDWSPTSNFLQHGYIHWMTRGLYVGHRRLYYNSQVDDMHLATYLYLPTGGRFRARPSDMDAHVAWQANLNARLPAGSSYTIEIGHNGNGNIEWAINSDTNGICIPNSEIQYTAPPDTALEFQKVPGTGTDLWPTTPAAYAWSLACTAVDSLGAWFSVAKNRNAFWHVSHTFTHENLDNATYSDTVKELTFNKAWLSQIGLDAGVFASKGLIPPAITGMHNGDAIKAMLDNGILYAVGDSSRPALLNTVNEYWPLISTVAANGYDGLTIVPRWSTPIYYNCDMANCTLSEWVNTVGGTGDFNNLLQFSKAQYTRHLLGLRHDGFMFHQANMRYGDVPSFTVGTQTDNMSLLQIFTEVMLQEMMRLTTWPIVSIAHDDLAVSFLNRMARDQCKPTLSWSLSSDAKTITSVTVGANSNTCSVPIPVTFPGTASASSGSFYDEQLGTDPLTKWTTLSGNAVTYTLGTPVAV